MNALDFVEILFVNFNGFNHFIFSFWAVFGLILLVLETVSNGIKGVPTPEDVVCVPPAPSTSSDWIQAQLAEFDLDSNSKSSKLWGWDPDNLPLEWEMWGSPTPAPAPVAKEGEEWWELHLLWAGA